MSNVINLGRARKRKRQEAEQQQADANAIKHGRTKADDSREHKERGRIGATLDGARLERATPDEPEPNDAAPSAPEPDDAPNEPELDAPELGAPNEPELDASEPTGREPDAPEPTE